MTMLYDMRSINLNTDQAIPEVGEMTQKKNKQLIFFN